MDELSVTSQAHDKLPCAQVNLEADTTEELGNWIDQYPPPRSTTEGIDQCCHTEEQHRERSTA